MQSIPKNGNMYQNLYRSMFSSVQMSLYRIFIIKPSTEQSILLEFGPGVVRVVLNTENYGIVNVFIGMIRRSTHMIAK